MFGGSKSFIDESTGMMGVLSIKSSYEIFRNREFLSSLFLFLDARSIVRITKVSKTFLGVGRSNFLWNEILKKPKAYFEKDLIRVSDLERLDVRSGNIYSKVESVMKRSSGQSFIEGTEAPSTNKTSKKANTTISGFLFLFYYMLLSFTSCVCPPIGILIQGLVAYCKYVEVDRRETKGSWLPIGSALDISGSFLLTLCGFSPFILPCCMIQCLSTCCCWCCCLCCIPGLLWSILTACVHGFIHSTNFSFHHLLIWLGRFYFFDDQSADPIAELFTSPSIWILGTLFGFERIKY